MCNVSLSSLSLLSSRLSGAAEPSQLTGYPHCSCRNRICSLASSPPPPDLFSTSLSPSPSLPTLLTSFLVCAFPRIDIVYCICFNFGYSSLGHDDEDGVRCAQQPASLTVRQLLARRHLTLDTSPASRRPSPPHRHYSGFPFVSTLIRFPIPTRLPLSLACIGSSADISVRRFESGLPISPSARAPSP